MALPIPKLVLPTTSNIARELDEIYKDLHELDFIEIEGPKMLQKKESLQKEKQISVDPISLRESSLGEISFNMMLTPNPIPDDSSAVPFPPPLLPAKHNFLSCSLPNSATSSPRFGSILSRKKLRNESQASPRQIDKLVNQKSSTAAAAAVQYHVKNNPFWRSKSCGEGRTCAPPHELDEYIWLRHENALEYNNNNKHHGHGSFMISNPKIANNDNEDEFKCSALCLFLPGFGRAKSVRARKAEAITGMEKKNSSRAISRTVSLEKFECGSWASSAMIADHDEDAESVNLYFDLPLELIKNLGNDAHLPVSAAFVFDNKDIKGVLKNGSSTSTRTASRKLSHESSRHVRFSTSSPASYPASPASSCITPRLRKARDDFNAFLEAQSA